MIIHGDATQIPLADNSVDTCITDPPYHLTSITKRFGKENSAPAKYGTDGAYARASAGFMGKTWDGGDVAFDPATWAEVYRVLKPGALLLSFGGTRTYHRMVCAIEDAGFEIRDTIAWVYGSGFPKSYDISKGIDKQAGAEREVIGKHPQPASEIFAGGKLSKDVNLTAPSTPEAQLWNGWGTALKPAMELIVVAMKPLDGTYAENALKWGVAGLWIDGGRVGADEVADEAGSRNPHGPSYGNKYGEFKGGCRRTKGNGANSPQGRFPANLIHDGSDEVVGLFPQSKGGVAVRHNSGGNTFGGNNPKPPMEDMSYNDSGSASRFFYCAKASRAERNAGLEGMEAQRKAGAEFRPNHMEKAMNGEDGNPYGRWGMTQNNHPTVKPIELMRYLVRLTKTPTGGVVLDPFMGSGTTGCACALEGREFIGIEKEAEYIEIAQKRIAYWSKQPKLPVE